MSKLKVIGMYKDYDVATKMEGSEGKFEEVDYLRKKYYIYVEDVVDNEVKTLQLILYEEHDVCPSGWYTASWGVIEVGEVIQIGSFIKYIPKDGINPYIDSKCINGFKNEFKCDFFEVNIYGWDDSCYGVRITNTIYPCGYIKINKEAFTPFSPNENVAKITKM